jgi:hypothetical protein
MREGFPRSQMVLNYDVLGDANEILRDMIAAADAEDAADDRGYLEFGWSSW